MGQIKGVSKGCATAFTCAFAGFFDNKRDGIAGKILQWQIGHVKYVLLLWLTVLDGKGFLLNHSEQIEEKPAR